MERLIAWAMRNPGTVLIVVLVTSIDAASQLPQLQVVISPQSLIIEGDLDEQFYEDMLATLGSDRITIVYVADPDLFRRKSWKSCGKSWQASRGLPSSKSPEACSMLPKFESRTSW